MIYPLQVALLRKRDEMFTQAKLVDAVNADLGIKSTAYVGTLLAKEGSGMFLREYIAKELPSSTLHDMCIARGKGLEKSGWLNGKQGLRCNFLFKGMDPTQDSGLGGYYMTAEDPSSAEEVSPRYSFCPPLLFRQECAKIELSQAHSYFYIPVAPTEIDSSPIAV